MSLCESPTLFSSTYKYVDCRACANYRVLQTELQTHICMTLGYCVHVRMNKGHNKSNHSLGKEQTKIYKRGESQKRLLVKYVIYKKGIYWSM